MKPRDLERAIGDETEHCTESTAASGASIERLVIAHSEPVGERAVHEVLGGHYEVQPIPDLGRIEIPDAAVAENASFLVLYIRAPADSNLTHGSEAYLSSQQRET